MKRHLKRGDVQSIAGLILVLSTYLQTAPGMERYEVLLGALIVACSYIVGGMPMPSRAKREEVQ